MPEFETPTCDRGHPATRMEFLESFDPPDVEGGGIGQPEPSGWRARWRYACPECGRVIEITEGVAGEFEEETVRDAGGDAADDPTSLSPVKD